MSLWYSTLVPEWYLRLLATITDNARLFPSFVVTRVVTMIWINEYNKPDSHYHLEAGRYTQINLTIEIYFHATKQPKDDTVKAWHVEKNGVTEMKLKKNDGGAVPFYEIYVRKLRNESIRIFWEL